MNINVWVPGINKNLYRFFNFQNLPLMRYHRCYFSRGDGKNILEKNIYWRDSYNISLRSSLFPIDLMDKVLLIPICPMF
jgi:hypothetical protein